MEEVENNTTTGIVDEEPTASFGGIQSKVDRVRQMFSDEARPDARIAVKALEKKFIRGKAFFGLQFHLWSGKRVQSDEELLAMGIRDIEAYKRQRTKGSKELVPQSSLRSIKQVKDKLERNLAFMARRKSGCSNVYFVEEDKFNEAVEMVVEAELELQTRLFEYFERPVPNENGEQLPSKFELDREAAIDRFCEEIPTIPRTDWERDYPSVEKIKSKYYIYFEVSVMPVDAKISELVDEYMAAKIIEESERTIEQTSEGLRGLVVQALQSFRSTVSGKNPDQKVNARTIKMVQNAFDQFKSFGSMVGDTSMAELVDAASLKFELAQSWTVEEISELKIDEAIKELLDVATDSVRVEFERDQFISGIYVDEDDSDQDELQDEGVVVGRNRQMEIQE